MDIRCENCGKLLAVSEKDTNVSGSIEIKCPKCKWVNRIEGNINKGFVQGT